MGEVLLFNSAFKGHAFVAFIIVGGFEGLNLLFEKFFCFAYFGINKGCNGFWVGVSSEVRRESVSSALTSRCCLVRTRCRFSAVAL